MATLNVMLFEEEVKHNQHISSSAFYLSVSHYIVHIVTCTFRIRITILPWLNQRRYNWLTKGCCTAIIIIHLLLCLISHPHHHQRGHICLANYDNSHIMITLSRIIGFLKTHHLHYYSTSLHCYRSAGFSWYARVSIITIFAVDIVPCITDQASQPLLGHRGSSVSSLWTAWVSSGCGIPYQPFLWYL